MQNNNESSYPNPKYSWYVVVILFLAFTVSYIDRQVISLLVGPMKADLGLSDSDIGWLQGAAFAIFYTFAGIPLGRLADKKNRRNIIVAGMFFWSIMTAACGMARGFWALFAARIGVGVGEACLSPSANSMITDYFPKDKRGKPVALYFMGVYVGVGLSYILGGMVTSWATGAGQIALPFIGDVQPWQLTFLIVSLPGIILLPLMFTIKEPIRRILSLKVNDEEKSSVDLKNSQGSLLARIKADPATVFFMLHKKAYLSIFLGFGVAGSMAIAFFAWTPTLFSRVHGWEASEIGYAFGTIVMTMGTLGIVISVFIADKLIEKGQKHAFIKVAIWSALGAMVFAGTAAMVSNPILALALLCPAVMCFGMPVALAPAAVNFITPGQFRGQALAIYIFAVGLINQIVGASSVPLLTDNVFKDEMAINLSLLSVTIILGLSAASIFWMSIKAYTNSAEQMLAQDSDVILQNLESEQSSNK